MALKNAKVSNDEIDLSDPNFVIDSREKLEAVLAMPDKKSRPMVKGGVISPSKKTPPYSYPEDPSGVLQKHKETESVEIPSQTKENEKVDNEIITTLQNENKVLKEEYAEISQRLQMYVDKLSEQTVQSQTVQDLENKVRLLSERHQELLKERNDAVEKLVGLQDDLKTLRQQTYDKARHDIDKQTDALQQEKVNTDLGII